MQLVCRSRCTPAEGAVSQTKIQSQQDEWKLLEFLTRDFDVSNFSLMFSEELTTTQHVRVPNLNTFTLMQEINKFYSLNTLFCWHKFEPWLHNYQKSNGNMIPTAETISSHSAPKVKYACKILDLCIAVSLGIPVHKMHLLILINSQTFKSSERT